MRKETSKINRYKLGDWNSLSPVARAKDFKQQGWGKFAHRPITAPSIYSGYMDHLYMLGVYVLLLPLPE